MSYAPINSQPPDYGAITSAHSNAGFERLYPPGGAPSQQQGEQYPGWYQASQPAAEAAVPGYGNPAVTTYVIAPPQPAAVVYPGPTDSYASHMVLACCVLWFCNILFGFIAFILAVVADGRKLEDRASAYRIGKASICCSVSGIVVTVVAIAVFLGVFFGVYGGHLCPYFVDGICYWKRRFVGPCPGCCYLYEHYDNHYCYGYDY